MTIEIRQRPYCKCYNSELTFLLYRDYRCSHSSGVAGNAELVEISDQSYHKIRCNQIPRLLIL